MELNYKVIPLFKEILHLSLTLSLNSYKKRACQKQINQPTFIKETRNDKLAINLLEKDYIQVTTSQSTPKVSL